MIDGITFLDELSWDAFNEGSHLMDYLEQYKRDLVVTQKTFWERKYIAREIIEKS